MKNEIYAMQINGATVLVLTPIDASGNLMRFRIDKVGAQFATQKIAEPGDTLFLAKLVMPKKVGS